MDLECANESEDDELDDFHKADEHGVLILAALVKHTHARNWNSHIYNLPGFLLT